MNRRLGFAALLAVVGVSIVFGMVLGGKLNAPSVMQAARERGAVFAQAPPGPGGAVGTPNFADIAEDVNDAVVSVTNTSVRRSQGDDMHDQFRNDPFFRWFFGPQGPQDRPGRRTPEEQRVVSGGSGFLISRDGYILTNNHVVEGSTRLVVGLNDGEKVDAEVIGTDPAIDVALIKINPKGKTLHVLPLGDSDKLRVGEWVMAIGNPLNLEHTVTVGVVSAKGRDIGIGSADFQLARLIQTDAAINFGNSGGPLVDSQGQVVGINTAIIRGDMANPVVQGIGFAVPINEARKAAEQLRETGSVQRGYLGINMVPAGISDAARRSLDLPDADGVIIESVVPDGPSDKAGLKEDDVIRKVEGESIKDNRDLLSRIASRRPGEKVNLDVLRNGRMVHATVTLGSRPARNGPQQEPSQDEGESGEAEGLGIRVEALTPRTREQIAQQMEIDPKELHGVLVTDVDLDSPAADEGIQSGIVITSVNNHSIETIADWNQAVRSLKPGDAVKIKVRLGQVERSVFVLVPEKKAR